MSFSSYDAIIRSFTDPAKGQVVNFHKESISSHPGFLYRLWRANGMPGAAPTEPPPIPNGELTDNNTLGALKFVEPTGDGNDQWLLYMEAGGRYAATLILYDRLWHAGDINLASTDLQIVNSLPLSRYQDGNGVKILLEITLKAGSTTRVATIRYTNEEGIAGRIATLTIPGSCPVNRCYYFRLQEGDKGVRSIQSFQLNGSMGGGKANLVLVKELSSVCYAYYQCCGKDMVRQTIGLQRVFYSDGITPKKSSCLALMALANTTTVGDLFGSISLCKE